MSSFHSSEIEKVFLLAIIFEYAPVASELANAIFFCVKASEFHHFTHQTWQMSAFYASVVINSSFYSSELANVIFICVKAGNCNLCMSHI